MIVPDLNLLIYATNRDSPRHAASRTWWEDTLSADIPVGVPWIVTLGFLRLTTNAGVFPQPLKVEASLSIVSTWFTAPCVRMLEPTERHWGILRDLLVTLGAAGNLTTDAHLAALAIEHGATLFSTDNDFARFPKLNWRNPLEG